MSLDGFFTGTDGVFNWFTPDEQFFEYAKDLLRSVDAIVFGRKTYQMMAEYWPTAPASEIEKKMNGLPKIVFSSGLRSVDWQHTTLLATDPIDEIARLKQLPGQDMVIFGSAMLSAALLKAGLVDEYRVILAPVLLGRGLPMFSSVTERMNLRLFGSRSFASGICVLSYGRA